MKKLPWILAAVATCLWLVTTLFLIQERREKEFTIQMFARLVRAVEKTDANVAVASVDMPPDTKGLEDILTLITSLPPERRHEAGQTVASMSALSRAAMEGVQTHNEAILAVRAVIDLKKAEEEMIKETESMNESGFRM